MPGCSCWPTKRAHSSSACTRTIVRPLRSCTCWSGSTRRRSKPVAGVEVQRAARGRAASSPGRSEPGMSRYSSPLRGSCHSSSGGARVEARHADERPVAPAGSTCCRRVGRRVRRRTGRRGAADRRGRGVDRDRRHGRDARHRRARRHGRHASARGTGGAAVVVWRPSRVATGEPGSAASVIVTSGPEGARQPSHAGKPTRTVRRARGATGPHARRATGPGTPAGRAYAPSWLRWSGDDSEQGRSRPARPRGARRVPDARRAADRARQRGGLPLRLHG